MPRWGLALVRGRSMLPTLRPGDRLLVRYGGRAEAGRLAVVVLPGGVLGIKRLAWLEPAGWWVERDNPAEGSDSWTLGAVPPPDVRAVVVCRLWPPRWGPAARRSRV